MDKKKNEHISICFSFLLKYRPEAAKLDKDRYGWVSVEQLICNVNAAGRNTLILDRLQDIGFVIGCVTLELLITPLIRT